MEWNKRKPISMIIFKPMQNIGKCGNGSDVDKYAFTKYQEVLDGEWVGNIWF